MRSSACEAMLHKYFASLGPKVHVLPDCKLSLSVLISLIYKIFNFCQLNFFRYSYQTSGSIDLGICRTEFSSFYTFS